MTLYKKIFRAVCLICLGFYWAIPNSNIMLLSSTTFMLSFSYRKCNLTDTQLVRINPTFMVRINPTSQIWAQRTARRRGRATTSIYIYLYNCKSVRRVTYKGGFNIWLDWAAARPAQAQAQEEEKNLDINVHKQNIKTGVASWGLKLGENNKITLTLAIQPTSIDPM